MKFKRWGSSFDVIIWVVLRRGYIGDLLGISFNLVGTMKVLTGD